MPYLTPQDLPEDDDCRPLSIPASSEWLALFGGALTELTKTWNWQDSGGLTVAETVAKMEEIINNWYIVPCAACTTPGGYRVIRINNTGHLEQLDENGDWEPATDDYYIPPPEAREGGTEDDQICLAAKNAVNVLEQLYEDLSESWASHLSEAEAITSFLLLLIGLVGFEFAPITGAIVAFFAAVFTILYNALEYLGADLWDEAFTKQITCFLVDCASNTAGVVTFDWECFNAHLNSLADDFVLSETQLRLYAQVGYILFFIGGGDALNLAARTTEITNDDCSFCDDTWCYRFDDANRLADWIAGFWSHAAGETAPTYSSSAWHEGVSPSRVSYIVLSWALGSAITITDAAITATTCPQTGGGQGIWINGSNSEEPFGGVGAVQIWDYNGGFLPGIYGGVTSINITMRTVDAGMPAFTLSEMQFAGTGENPFGENNC